MNGGRIDMNEATRELRLAPEPVEPVEKKGHWYLLTGVILGIMLGLLYAWVINPVIYENTLPASMNEPYKDSYRHTIAEVFSATGNLERAKQRLALLEDEDVVFVLGAQAQQALAKGDSSQAHALALLASALQSGENAQPLPAEPTAQPPADAVPTQTLPALTPIP